MGVAAPESVRRRHRVLLLEDDPDARQTILSTLKKASYAVTEAADSNQAAILLNLNEPPPAVSAIVCDIRAASVQGIEAAAYFRARYPHIPVIVTTTYPDIEWAITLMKRGVTDYLVKPLSRDDLLVVLKNALDRYVVVRRGLL